MYTDPYPVEGSPERLGIDIQRHHYSPPLGWSEARVSLPQPSSAARTCSSREPSAGLDPQSRNVVFDIIREQRELGTAIVLTTHLIDDAQKLADYVYIVKTAPRFREGTVSSSSPATARTVSQYSLNAPHPLT